MTNKLSRAARQRSVPQSFDASKLDVTGKATSAATPAKPAPEKIKRSPRNISLDDRAYVLLQKAQMTALMNGDPKPTISDLIARAVFEVYGEGDDA